MRVREARGMRRTRQATPEQERQLQEAWMRLRLGRKHVRKDRLRWRLQAARSTEEPRKAA